MPRRDPITIQVSSETARPLLGYGTNLWELGFSPEVFKKDKQTDKANGVDLSLTKDMLSHAFMNHYDAAVLVSETATIFQS
jgi:hypothetical protein